MAEPLLKLTTIPGRGRVLLASRDIKAGEILLSDSPLLLYPSSSSSSFCFHCFHLLPFSPFPCPTCSITLFCSPSCLSTSLSSSHPASICHSILTLPPIPDPNLFSLSRFLLSASILSSSDFRHLLSLNGGDSIPPPHQDAIFLHSILAPLTGFSLQLISTLIAIDGRNAFGLMEPFRDGGDAGDRRVRAYGIYPIASFFNHDCLPNACRFDYLDRDGDGNADIRIRAIHDIPEGREVCLSYFPVNWGYGERQERLMEDYGFRCVCDRCEVEKNWKNDDDDDEEEEEEEEEEDFPHAYFFVRYVCGRENCGGTLAPLPPSPQGAPSGLMECNVCGQLRKDDGFGGDE